MHRMVYTSTVVLALATCAGAQTKISGTQQCGKPDPINVIPVADRAGHAFSIAQTKCTWPKPIEIEGLQTKEDVGTAFDETRGVTASGQGYDISTMSNGDKFYVRFDSSTKLKDNVPTSMEGKWSFTGGTGKLKGIKGGGTYKGKGNADGTATFDIEGEYSIAK